MFLYLTTDGLTINKSGGRFVIWNPETKEENEQQIPISLVEGIVIFGRIQLSTDTIRACLKGKIPVFFLSKTGNLFGKLDSLEIKNIELLYKHINASIDKELCLKYAKIFIKAKIGNSRVMLQRRNRFYTNGEVGIENTLDKLKESLKNVEFADNLDSLRGVEGNAAKIYFEGFSKFITEPFKFNGRNRRPPKDEVNSLLSLGYTLLAQTIQMILSIQGLETQIGFFHQPKDLKSLLVLDIMEMYRARIVDDLVVRLIRNKKITIDQFFIDPEDEKRPVNLTDEGLKTFIGEYYKVIFKEKGINPLPYENDFIKLKIIEKNLEEFKQSLVKDTYDYEGFKIK